MIETKVTTKEVFDAIVAFEQEFNRVPNTGFLAGLFKVDMHTITNKLKLLERDGHIKRIKAKQRYMSYKIIK